MKILFLSDLHLEFGTLTLQKCNADLIVLAGDIWTGIRGIKWALDSLPDIPIIYVAGNHEHYGETLPRNYDKLRAAALNSRLYLLENDAITINNVTFHGCTLWTDFALFGTPAADTVLLKDSSNDYKKIRVPAESGMRRFTPIDAKRIHEQSLSWLAKSLSDSFTATNIVVTHHAPSMKSVAECFREETNSANYASHLDDFVIKYQPNVWIHGHMHHSIDYMLGSTKIVCNPRSYHGVSLNPDFDPYRTLNV